MHVKCILTGGTPSPMIGLVTLTKEILPVQVRPRNLYLSGNHASMKGLVVLTKEVLHLQVQLQNLHLCGNSRIDSPAGLGFDLFRTQ